MKAITDVFERRNILEPVRIGLMLHFRRIGIELLNIIVNHDWFFRLVGLVNRWFGIVESVFIAYAANEKYALAYGYPKRIRKQKWDPWLTGVLVQNKKLVIMFSISANENDLKDPQNVKQLNYLVNRAETLKELVSARQKTFAGILPGVLYSKRIIREVPEADLTAAIIVQAVEMVKKNEALEAETPIIVLGGRGFIGRRVVKLLPKEKIYTIDLSEGQGKNGWPSYLGKREIVLNITQNNALFDYLKVIRPKTVVINDVYPEPTLDVLEELWRKNCTYYHISGVKALSIPAFPGAYKGAIPACAAWPSPKMAVVVRKINK